MGYSRSTVLRTLGAVTATAALGARAGAQEPQKIRVIGVPTDLYAQAYFAQDAGFFAKSGLNVEVTSLGSGAQTAAAVLGGSADIGITSVVGLAAAVTRGAPLTIIAGAGLYSSDLAPYALCVAKASPLRTAKDLEGRTVGVTSLNDAAAVAMFQYLTRAGADREKVHFFEMPFTEMGVAIGLGRVDAAVIPEPGLTVALNNGARLFAKPFDAIGSPVSIGAFISTIDWVRKYPTQTRRFADAIYAAGHWANTHHDDSAVILAKYTKMELPTIRAMVRSLSAEQLTPQMLQPMLDAAFRYNLIARKVTADELIAKPS